MKNRNCVGCNKPLKTGEFVILNGGALIKTKAGSMMEDKNHIGFLTVNNHFDSKKNYRTFIVADNAPNGQFEFYACSHKCLANFMTKQIMHLSNLDKIKKFNLASRSKLDKVGYKWGQKIVKLMGFKDALITDQSTISNFMYAFEQNKFESGQSLENFINKLGFKIKKSDLIWKIALKYKNMHSPVFLEISPSNHGVKNALRN